MTGDVLAAFAWALDQASAVLHESPSECLAQLSARLTASARQIPATAAALARGVSTSSRPWLRLRNWHPRPLLRELSGHTSSIQSCNFALRGARVLSTSLDGTVRLWETSTGREVQRYTTRFADRSASIAPDGVHVAFLNDSRGLVLASALDGRDIAILPPNVTSWSFSSDGRWLAVRRADCRVTVYRVQDGAVHREDAFWSEHGSVRFIANGMAILVLTPEALEVWDAEGNRRRRLESPGPRRNICLSPDGEALAAEVDGRGILVWSLESGEEISRQDRHRGALADFQFLARSPLLVSAEAAGRILVWDRSSGEPVLVFDAGQRIDRILFDATERTLVTGTRERRGFESLEELVLWDLGSGVRRGGITGHRSGHGVRDHAFSPDGRRLFLTSADSSLRAWDTDTGECLAVFSGHRGEVLECAIDAEAMQLVSGGSDGILRLWSVADEALWMSSSARGHGAEVSACAAGAGGIGLAVGSDGTISWWNAAGERLSQTEEAGTSVPAAACAISPDGKLAAVGGGNGELRIMDSSARRLEGTLVGVGTQSVVACEFNPAGTRIVWRTMGSGKYLGSVREGWSRTILPGPAVWAARFVPPGDRVVTISNSHPFLRAGGAITLFDGRTGERLTVWDCPDEVLRDAAVSPDGRWLATGARPGIRLWSLEDGSSVTLLQHSGGEVGCCGFSPDGKWLMGIAGTVCIWETGSWLERGGWKAVALPRPVFLPDGEHLVTVHSRTVSVWNLPHMRLVCTLTGLVGGITALAVAPDGTWLLIGTSQGEVLVASIEGIGTLPVVTAQEASLGLQVRCPACGAAGEVEQAALGVEGACPGCGSRFELHASPARLKRLNPD